MADQDTHFPSSGDPHSVSEPTGDAGRRGQHSRRNAIIAVIVVLLVGYGIWKFTGTSSSADGGGKSSKGRPPTTVGVIRVARANMPVTLTAIGTVQPIINATVRAQEPGVLTQIYFQEGQHVRQGQALGQIDSRTYQAQLEQAQGTLAKDEANINAAKVDLRRYQTLLKEDSIASQQVDTQAATVKQLQGTLTTDRGAIRNARVNLGYTTLRAPVSGKVGLRQVDIGSYVATGDVNGIVTITVTDPIDVSFSVPQNQIPQIQTAARGRGIPVTVFDQSNTTILAHGAFRTFDNAIDPTSGTVKAKARVTNGDESLFPNEFVNVQLLLDTINNAMVVPVSAVRTGPSGSFVYVMTPDKIAHRVAVTTGPSDSTRQVITSGLDGSEVIIFEGADRIDDGSKVVAATANGPGHGPSGGGHHGRANGQNGPGMMRGVAGATPPAGQPAAPNGPQPAPNGGSPDAGMPNGGHHRHHPDGSGSAAQ